MTDSWQGKDAYGAVRSLVLESGEESFGEEHQAWEGMVSALRPDQLSIRVASATHFCEIYRRRVEWSRARGLSSTASLELVLGKLESCRGSEVAFLFAEQDDYGYFLWVDRELARVVAHYRTRRHAHGDELL